MNIPMIGFMVFFVTSVLFAYGWGWQNGHDSHYGSHDEDPPPTPPANTPFWR